MADDTKSTDRRRFNRDGSPRVTEERADGRRSFSFNDIEQPVARTFNYLRAQIRWGRVPEVPFWFQISGLLASARLIYVGIVALQADRRPKRLVIPASILVRSLLETLANVMALAENPEKHSLLFTRDGYLNAWRLIEQLKPHATGTEWEGWVESRQRDLERFAKHAHLSPEEAADPRKRLKEWPRMGNIYKPGGLITGDRATAFEILYVLWYRNLSSFAHQRLTAAAQAWIMEEGERPFDVDLAVSNVVFSSSMLMASILSEILLAGSFEGRPDLPALWAILEKGHPTAKRLLDLRYAKALGIPS
jgi:hypothetical protein